MDGLEMLKQVHTSNKTIPAIILSALETTDSLNQSRRARSGKTGIEVSPQSKTESNTAGIC